MNYEELLSSEEINMLGKSTRSINIYTYLQEDGLSYTGTYERLMELTGYSGTYIRNLNYTQQTDKRIFRAGVLRPVIAVYNKNEQLEAIGTVKELPYHQSSVIKMIKVDEHDTGRMKASIIDYELELLTTPVKEGVK